jgi:hypothetical protein
MTFTFNDGGRADAGFRGKTGDCVTRSIAIATGRPYREVYNAINDASQGERPSARKRGKSSARTGVHKQTFRSYLVSLDWRWVPTMAIGQGCKVHLTASELPGGTILVSVSRHLTCMIDGVIHDTFDPSRGGTRCVYGYFTKEPASRLNPLRPP